jgi:hypothetical protein
MLSFETLHPRQKASVIKYDLLDLLPTFETTKELSKLVLKLSTDAWKQRNPDYMREYLKEANKINNIRNAEYKLEKARSPGYREKHKLYMRMRRAADPNYGKNKNKNQNQN